MADTIHCVKCGEDNPPDSRFCIDCGAPLAPAPIDVATTGPTIKLSGKPCMACRTLNADTATVCVSCGKPLVSATPATPPPVVVVKPVAPRVPPPNYGPWQGSWNGPRHPPRPKQGMHPEHVIWIVAGIAMLVLLSMGRFWPGILLVMGFASLASAWASGRAGKGLMSLLWLGGLALLFTTGMFWPGIPVLLFMFWGFGGRHRRPW